jgi:hypothetical protein
VASTCKINDLAIPRVAICRRRRWDLRGPALGQRAAACLGVTLGQVSGAPALSCDHGGAAESEFRHRHRVVQRPSALAVASVEDGYCELGLVRGHIVIHVLSPAHI